MSIEEKIFSEGASSLPVAGIDFGTTQSLVALRTNKGIELLTDPVSGQAALPSVVWIGNEGEAKTGQDAVARANRDPSQTFYSIKRFLGRDFDQMAELCKKLPYFTGAPEQGIPELKTGDGWVHPVELAEEIFRALKERAERRCGSPLGGAVLTVPAYFDDVQRKCIKDAANLAGIRVLRLLNEPTAAALAYLSERGEQDEKDPKLLAVYDFGGGTFDFSVLRVYGPFIEVLATGGDTLLGGDDLDAALATRLQEQWRESFPTVLLGDYEQKRQWRCFLQLASEIKVGLSQKEQVQAQYGRWQISVSRSVFNEIASPVVSKSFEIIQEVMDRAGLQVEELNEILLVGGPTQLPLFRELLQGYFKKQPNISLDPEGAVALGAASHAEALVRRTPYQYQGEESLIQKEGEYLPVFQPDSQQRGRHTLLDVTPMSFGLETLDDRVEIFLPRNTPLPSSCTHRFTNASDRQTQIPFHVLQGESPRASECRSLARFILTGLPSKPAGQLDIKVTFSVDVNGLLKVSAEETESGCSHTLITQPTYRIPSDILEELEEQEEVDSLGSAPVAKSEKLQSLEDWKEEVEGFIGYVESSGMLERSTEFGSEALAQQVREDFNALKLLWKEGKNQDPETRALYTQLCRQFKRWLVRYR